MVTVRRAAQVAGVVAVSTIMTVVALGLVEGGLRAVWALRNFRLEAVVLPYVVDDYGPVPPWADAARVLEPDPALLWRSRAGVERRYVDVFTPILNGLPAQAAGWGSVCPAVMPCRAQTMKATESASARRTPAQPEVVAPGGYPAVLCSSTWPS